MKHRRDRYWARQKEKAPYWMSSLVWFLVFMALIFAVVAGNAAIERKREMDQKKLEFYRLMKDSHKIIRTRESLENMRKAKDQVPWQLLIGE